MTPEDYKSLDVCVEDENYKLSVEYDHTEQEFTEDSRVIVLYSKVKYRTNLFNWESTMPTVRIPYRDPATGFLLNGVIFSSVGIYQRAPGVVIGHDDNESATGKECIDIVTSRNTTFSIAYRRHGIHIIFRRSGKEKSVPIGIFLKALSGLPYSVILQKFAFKPPALRYSFPCEVANRSVDLAKVATYGIDSDEEPTIDDCVNAVYRAIVRFDSNGAYSTHWKLGRIKAFFGSLHFKSEQNYEAVLSVHSRAIGTYLDQELSLPIYKVDQASGQVEIDKVYYPRGTFVNEQIASQLRWYDIPQLRVKYERSYLLQEDTPYLFRAKGYMLVDDVPECNLRAGTVLGEDELKVLNQSSVKILDVNTPQGKRVVTRSGVETTVGDFITLLNALFTCAYRQLDESSQYELANRIVVNYDRQVALEIEQTYQDIINGLGGCQQLQNILQSLPKLPSNHLAEYLRDSDNKELAQADNTNVLSRAIAEGRTSALMREAPAAMTGIQLGQYGRVDSLHAPESDKVGAVQELTVMSKINPQTGEIEVPYEKIVDGYPTGVIEYVSAAKEKGKYVVGWDEKFDQPYVQARYNGDVTTVAKEQVSFRDVSPFCDMSVSRMTVPFPEFSQPRRSLMASKMTGQAVPILFPERPLVSTGADTEIPCLYYTVRDMVTNAIGAENIVEGEQLELINVKWTKAFANYTCLYCDKSFVFSVPFTATDKETLYSYNLNYKEGYKYNLDDIVFFNQSCDIREYEMAEYIEQGAVPLIKGAGRPSLALGVNLRVGYKTHGSSTVDDAMTISDRLIKDRRFSSIQIFKYEYELRGDEEFSSYNAIVKLHSYVYSGMPVISSQRKTNSGIKEKHIRSDVDGEAIYVNINEATRSAEVYIACIHDAQLGDKAAGRHGNKSVIARIVPEEMMPYDPISGEHLDAIISPLGIPSRMNNGQLIEATLGYAMQVQGKHAVVTPFYPGIKDEVQRLYDGVGGKMIRLYNPVYGKFTERPIFVGNMYFMKLEQMSNLKISAVGAPRSVDPVFGQPIDSATEFKGQAISEMETWVFAATGAKKILNNLFTLYSSDAYSRNRYFNILSGNPDDGQPDSWDETIGDAVQMKVDNKNALATQTVMRMFGQELQPMGETTYGFLPLNLDDITVTIIPLDLKNHTEPVLDNEWCKVKLQAPVVNPFWIRNFPLNLVLGVKSVNTLVDQKHYLDVFTRQTIPGTELSDQDKTRYITGINAVIALLRNTTIDDALARLMNKTAVDNLSSQGEVVETLEGEVILNPDDPMATEEAIPIHVPVGSADLIQFLQRLKENGFELNDLVWEYLPVMPKVFRQTTVVRGKEHEHSFQKQLRHICDCASSQDIYDSLEALIGYGTQRKDDLMSLRGYFFGKDSQSRQHGKIRSAVLSQRVGFSGRTVIIPSTDIEMSPYFIGIPWRVAMVELADILSIRMQKRAPRMSAELQQELSNGSIALSHLTTKEWSLLLKSLGEYNDYIFHKMFPGLDYSDRLFVYNYFRNIVRDICQGNVSSDGRVRYKGEWRKPEELPDDAVIDACVVLVGRQPTLHKLSIRSFFMWLVDGYCTQIHPMICSGFNADFDGDQMWDAQMLGEMKNEALKTMSVLQDLISEKDGSYTLTISQDTALGLYCSTIFKDNAKTFQGEKGAFYFYDDKDALKIDLEYGKLNYYDVVLYRYNGTGKFYMSTAGRVLLNVLVPGALTLLPMQDQWGIVAQTLGEGAVGSLCQLKYDGTWVTTSIVADGYSKGFKIKDICKEVYISYGARASVDTAQALYEVGLVASDTYGVSASMDDMSVNVDVSPLMVQPKEYVNKLNTLKQLGLISEEERKEATIRAWERMHKQASKEIISALPSNSNLHYLLYSGARGKPGQIMQSIGFIGTISKTVSEDIEYPVLRGYGNGLSSLDLFQACYPTRIGLVSTQTGTKNTGYSTRQTVYMSSGMEVVEDDCGISNRTETVLYEDNASTVEWGDGHVGPVNELLGQFVDPAAEQYKPLMASLTRNGFVIDDTILDHLLVEGYTHIALLDQVVSLKRTLDPGWKRYALEDGYSYALPYTKHRKITEETVDWIERHGMLSIIMYDEYENEDDHCFDKEAYLPVDYVSDKYTLYLNGEETADEMVYGRVVDETSEGFHYYGRLLDEGNAMSMRALRYLTERQLREVKFVDGTVLTVKYEIASLFKELVLGCWSTGLLYLDEDSTITEETLKSIVKYQLEAIPVRSELTCLSYTGVCSKCHGRSRTTGDFAKIGTNLGIAAAQAQCEPLSQSTLNVTHSGGKRSAGIGLVSGLGYYMKMLTGRLVSKKTQDLLEDFTKVSGYVQKNIHDERFFQIVDEEGKVLESWTLNDADRCCVVDGAYVDKGTRVKSGWPRLDRYASHDIFKSALQTRYLLLQEYHRIFESLDVSPKTYVLLAREQTSICYLDKDINLPVTKDCSTEIHEPTDAYKLIVSPQSQVVNKYSGVAGFAFEDVASMLMSGMLQSKGLALNSVLGNLVTGTRVGTKKAKFIPKKFGMGSRGYTKSEVRKYEDAIAAKSVGEYSWALALDSSVRPEHSVSQSKALTDSLMDELLALGSGEPSELLGIGTTSSGDVQAMSLGDEPNEGVLDEPEIVVVQEEEPEMILPSMPEDEEIIDADIFEMPAPPEDDEPATGKGDGRQDGGNVGRLIL